MKPVAVIALGSLIVSCLATPRQQRKFPHEFLFGAASAAYQIEGGWNADDKGESIWDRMIHTNPEVIKDASNGDIACDTYHNYKRDVEMMRELGLDAYRFSISWSRILPTGRSNYISQAGVNFYNNYINEMVKYNITPMVTLYHWDLPQPLQDLGGFTNPLIAEWYEEYARVVFEAFGDRVKHWITFNEPDVVCLQGYGGDAMAPGINSMGIGEYLCAKHLVLAHAKAYHAYAKDFKDEQKGIVGIANSVSPMIALTDSEEDLAAAELVRQSLWGLYTHPIFSQEGGFPKELSDKVAKKSKEQGYAKSRMPTLTDEEKSYVQGTYDFFGMNVYSTLFVFANNYSDYDLPLPLYDVDAGFFVPEEWPKGVSSWLVQAPDTVYNALNHIKESYDIDPIFYITENGWSTFPTAGLVDDGRIQYNRAALDSALDALDAGVRLQGYMAWSLMDNFEWQQGYTERFGLYEVDFDSPQRTRTARKSAFVYKHIVSHRYIDYAYNPDTTTTSMSIDEGH